MRSTCTAISLGILLSALLLSACKQGEGDRCNWNDDCADDLVCCVTPENRVQGGVCVLPIQCDLTRTDGGVVAADSTVTQPDSKAADQAMDQAMDQTPAADQTVTPDLRPDGATAPDMIPPADTTPTPDQAPADSATE